MKAFLASVIFAVVLAVGSAMVLNDNTAARGIAIC